MKRSMPRACLALIMCVCALTLGRPYPISADPPPQRFTPDWSAPHVPGQLLVKLSDTGRMTAAEVRMSQMGVRVLRTIPQLGLALVEAPPGVDLRATSERLLAGAGAAWAEPNYTFSLDFVPNDPGYTLQTPYLSRINIAAAWDLNFGRPDIVLAVLDTGVDLAHPDLQGAIWRNPGELPGNGVDDDNNGFIDDVNGWDFAGNDNVPDDDHGHGTHVAGIAAAEINNGVGVAGVAAGAAIMPVDVFGGGIGAYEDLIRAIIYAADNGAHVINMSLGASSYSRGEQMAVDYAVGRGVVVVAAAGNTWSQVDHYPAAHANVIAVAATTADDTIASFSTRGEFVDVAAPGQSIYSTYRGGAYGMLSGTSMAAPHVSGLAALILSRNPGLLPGQVRALIETTADDLGAAGRDVYFGHGRINAGAALASTLASADPPPDRPGPPLDIWPAGCQELILDGGFEDGLGKWQVTGSAEIDAAQAYAGSFSVHFLGGANAAGVLQRTVLLPATAREGALWFAYRIEPQDFGQGATPDWPFDDWLVAEFTTTEGQALRELLRTGNSADTVNSGLPWDRYLYRMMPEDMLALRTAGGVDLVFRAQHDDDGLRTDFWVDSVRFCVTDADTITPTPTATPTAAPTATVTPTPSATPGPALYLPMIIL